MNEHILKKVAVKYNEYILPPYDIIMEMDGFDAICTFSKHFSGTSVYVPSIRTIFRQCLEMEMLNNYNGCNTKELVQNYGFSERHVRKLLQNVRKVKA